jgi:hypothetical protein
VPSLDDEKTMRLWLRRSFKRALWLTTNPLYIITNGSRLGPFDSYVNQKNRYGNQCSSPEIS